MAYFYMYLVILATGAGGLIIWKLMDRSSRKR